MTGSGQNGTQRVRHFEGELLTARDLQDDVAYETRLRGLHVRALHNTWGIALGFDVRLDPNETTVLLGPGIAYDCRGREIISSRTIAVPAPHRPVPVQDGWFDLVMRHHDLNALLEGRRGYDCLGDGIHPSEERPAVRWAFAGEPTGADAPDLAEDVRPGEDIPLARFRISDSGTFGEPDFTFRRHAQGMVRPHIAGSQVAGDLEFNDTQMAWQTRVDTSAAGFSQTPFYFACLDEHPLLALRRRSSGDDSGSLDVLRSLLGPFVSIRTPGRTSFDFDVRFAVTPSEVGFTAAGVPAPPAVEGGAAFAAQTGEIHLPATINWIGVEPLGGCQPPVQFQLAVLLSGFFLRTPAINVAATFGATLDNLFLHRA